MRGVAALIVALHHFVTRSKLIDFSGYWPVDLFFVLSGFVIARAYDARMAGGLAPGRFIQRRLLRLYPLYAIGLTIAVAKHAFGGIVADPRALAGWPLACDLTFGLTMLPSPCADRIAPLNAPTWSLFFELYANIAFALLLWRLPRPALAATACAAAIWLVLVIAPPAYGNVGPLWVSIVPALPRVLFSFTAGILIARSVRVPRRTSWAAAAFPILLVVVACLQPAEPVRRAFDLALILALLPLIVAVAAVFDAPPALVRPFRLLGDLSYPIYIVHWFVVAVLAPLAVRAAWAPSTAIAIYLMVLLPLGYAMMILDARLRRWIGARLAVRQSALPQAA